MEGVCKPCWELKYCPYGPLVEDFPLLGPTRDEAIVHIAFLTEKLEEDAYDDVRTEYFKKQIESFDPNEYPESHQKKDLEKACSVFGHLCPVYFASESVTETRDSRRTGRHIPREIMLRVVRRDNNQCQVCSKVLLDAEIELDHIIPISKGGSSEEHNIRITCFNCNRGKSSAYEP